MFSRKIIKGLIPSTVLGQRILRSSSNCILLTFDDGPHRELTPLVLERLKANDARAVFFTVGRRIEGAPSLLRLIKDYGHLIGNHTYIHSNSNQPPFFEYRRDLIRCQMLIEKHAGVKPTLFRPPGGRISLASIFVPKLLGLKTIMWSLEGRDWSCQTPGEAKKIAEYLIQTIQPRDIVLLHDDNPNILIILDILLPFLKSCQFNLHSGIEFMKGDFVL